MYTAAQYASLLSLDIVELVCHLFTCPISALNFYLILQTSVLHPNLKFILICQSLCIFVRGAGQFIRCFKMLTFRILRSDRLIVLGIRLFTGDVAWGGKADLLILIYLFPIIFRNYLAHVLVGNSRISQNMAHLISLNISIVG